MIKRFKLVYLGEDCWEHEWDIEDTANPNTIIPQHGKTIVGLMNGLNDKNVQLKRKKERYKILAESRGERLDNYICTLNKFIKEHLEDESCNEAAKRVLRELSGTFVKEYDVSAENRKLRQENEELKQELFETRKDYIIETADISDKLYLDELIEEARKEIFE